MGAERRFGNVDFVVAMTENVVLDFVACVDIAEVDECSPEHASSSPSKFPTFLPRLQ